MIIFHEGLPGSGKSYEAMAKHAIPALGKGRPLYTNIEGIVEGAFKIAQILEKDVKEIISLINVIPEDEIRAIHKLKTVPEALILIDELQDYYPSDMRNIPQDERSYPAKHEHYGHDIIVMGQNLMDCNKLWRNRVARKITFMKRDMLGKPDEYTWTSYQGKLNGKTSEVEFFKLKSSGEQYDSKYFGTYKSVTADVENARVNYEDDRTNLLKNKWLKIIPIVCIGGLVWAIFTLTGFLGKGGISTAEASVSPSQTSPLPKQTKTPALPKQPQVKYLPVDYFDEIAASNKLRLSAVIYDDSGKLIHAYIDALVEGALVERFFISDVKTLGWNVQQRVYGILLSKGNKQYVVRPWPLPRNSNNSTKPPKSLT